VPSSSRHGWDQGRIANAVWARFERWQKAAHEKHRIPTLEERCEYLGASEDTVKRLVSAGKLPATRFDGRLRFDIQDLDTFIETSKRR